MPHWLPALRPGAMVLRHDEHHLQVGTSPGIVVADRPGLFALLHALDGTRPEIELVEKHPEVADLPATLQELVAVGAVVDATQWQRPAWSESRSLSLSSRAAEVAARAQRKLAVHSDVGSRDLTSAVRRLLTGSGVVHLDSDDPELLVVISSAEPARDVFDEAAHQGIDHLPVRHAEDRVLIGPVVVPGATPCVGCHDLHRVDWDPAWSALIPQFGVRSVMHNPPAPTALTLQSAAIEVADVIVAHLDGRAMGGRVISVGPGHRERHLRPVAFHPRCSCTLLLM